MLDSHFGLSHILLVDDDQDIQAIAKVALEIQGGFKVKTCSNGQMAIATIPSFYPDLILLDVGMPHMGGLTTYRLLREMSETVNIPVIFVTGRVQPHELEHYNEVGALGVIAKPFDPATLTEKIRQIWDRAYSMPVAMG